MCECDFCDCGEDIMIEERYAQLNLMRAISIMNEPVIRDEEGL